MTIHDLVRLDPATVKLWNGSAWTQVLGWSRRMAETMRITLRSGERIISSPNHRWPLADERVVETRELVPGDVLAAARLPEPEQPSDAGIPADLAWFAGLYLAEGSRSDDAIQIAGHVDEVGRHERTFAIAERYGGSAAMHQGAGNGVSVVVHGAFLDAAIRHFVAGRTALDKHLHPRAWRSSDATLQAFMEGYLAGDGAYDALNNRWRLGFGNNPQWADSLRTLAARLGVTLTLAPVLAKMGRTRTFEAYRGEWRWHAAAHWNTRNRAAVVKVEPRGETEVWDIGVADEPHLFALASGVLSHNSKPNPMPESVTDRPTKSHEYVFLLAKDSRYYYDADAVREPHQGLAAAAVARGYRQGDNVSPASHRSLPESQKPQYGSGHSNYFGADGHLLINPAGRNLRSVWTIATQALKGIRLTGNSGKTVDHYAAYPEALVEPCVKAGTSEKGACPECGAPWKRVVKRTRESRRGRTGESGTLEGGTMGLHD